MTFISYDGRGTALPNEARLVLEGKGLVVGEPFPDGHVSYPLGRQVAKPSIVPGNTRPNCRAMFGSGGPEVDAPSVYLYAIDGMWYVEVWEYVPGPGPGDFRHRHATLKSVLDDVLDYFFGPSVRTLAKAAPKFDAIKA